MSQQQVLPHTVQERRGAGAGVPVSDCLLSPALTSSLIAGFHLPSWSGRELKVTQYTTVWACIQRIKQVLRLQTFTDWMLATRFLSRCRRQVIRRLSWVHMCSIHVQHNMFHVWCSIVTCMHCSSNAFKQGEFAGSILEISGVETKPPRDIKVQLLAMKFANRCEPMADVVFWEASPTTKPRPKHTSHQIQQFGLCQRQSKMTQKTTKRKLCMCEM